MSRPAKFDNHQFARRRQYPVSARKTVDGWLTPGVDFGDYSRMSTQQHLPSGERRLATPVWAVNDKLLQELLVIFMEDRAGFRKPQNGADLRGRLEIARQRVINQRPRLIDILDKLCNEYVTIKRLGLNPETTDADWNAERREPYLDAFAVEARFVAEKKRKRDLEIEIEGIDTYLRYTVNGGIDIIAAIIYLYYRVGLDSVGVGTELNLKPPHIRQILSRLHETAEQRLSHLCGKVTTVVSEPLFEN